LLPDIPELREGLETLNVFEGDASKEHGDLVVAPRRNLMSSDNCGGPRKVDQGVSKI
jgi:hypothetical protein